MKQKLLTLLTVLISLVTFGQENNLIIKIETKKESKVRTDSTFINYYILNNQDTFYFPDNSTVIQCNYLQNIDKDHNKCRIYINQELGNGSIVIVLYNNSDKSSTTYSGTISNGLYAVGTYLTKSYKGLPLLTGQYYNNWKHGYWTTYYPNGRVETIYKFIEGASEFVKTWEFNEVGELISFTDEEIEILKLINKNDR